MSGGDDEVCLTLISSTGSKVKVRLMNMVVGSFFLMGLFLLGSLTHDTKFPQMEASLRQSLNEIKTMISKQSELGNIPQRHQRIFFLGREMKTGGRSLEALGVGRFGILTMHVHNRKPGCQQVEPQQQVVDLADESEDEVTEVQVVAAPQRKRRRRA